MLTEITAEGFGVELDIVYATTANFTGKPVYGRAACFLLPEAAESLRRAVALAAPLGYRLKVFDGFRPSEAQWKLWEHTPDPEFIADPRRGSPHSMGAAVDVTLVDAASGAELDMGTPFDDLRPLSHHGVTDIPVEAQRNRAILLGLMTAAGFDFFRNEWWHYQLFNARARYPVLSDAASGTRMMG
ncbi:D-alanyl-D-alanine dipeptidase [Novispirillum sp. DQ9]|uniref:D-alanyl-D-alanine dipeptidase n=1 Tax=Novispirillum sp. DQ9 TaxID=3398612 RepID=UPI003C7B5E5D